MYELSHFCYLTSKDHIKSFDHLSNILWLSVRHKALLKCCWLCSIVGCLYGDHSPCGWANFSVTDKTERHSLTYKAPLDLALLTTLASFLLTLFPSSMMFPLHYLFYFFWDLLKLFPSIVFLQPRMIFPESFLLVSTHNLGFSSDATSSDGPFIATQYNN